MNLSRIKVALWSVISLSLFLPVQIHAGPISTIIPKMSASYEFDTNFFAAEENERPVSTYLFQPGIELGVETPKSLLNLDFTLDLYYYNDEESVPSDQPSISEGDFIGYTGWLEAKHQAFDRLLLGFDGSSILTREPAFSDPLSNAVDRDLYYISELSPLAIYEFGQKFSVGLRYRYTDINFVPSYREDSIGNRGILDLIYSFTSRTSLDLEYQYWTRDYDLDSSDYTSNQIKLIFRRRFKNFTIAAGGGYQNRDFNESGLDDIGGFTYNLDIEGGGLLANRKSYIAFNIDQNFNDYGPENEYFMGTRFTLTAGHDFSKRLSGDIEAFYQISGYEETFGLTPSGDTERRKDDTFIISGTLGYEFARWLTLSGTGGYETRNSNLAGYSYDNSFVIVTLAFAYSLGKK